MASVDQHFAVRSLKRWHRLKDHPVWMKRFSEDDQERLLEEDLDAGYHVPLLLATLVSSGMILMAITVALILW